MSTAPVRKTDKPSESDKLAVTNSGVACYILADCSECGGEPELHLIRAKKLTRIVLDRADVLNLQIDDILGAYCTECGQMIEIDWRMA